MEFFKIRRDIPFMSWGKITTTISLVTFLLSVFFLFTRGLNFGIDFTGGTLMEVSYSKSADVNAVRKVLDSLDLKEATVQNFGTANDLLLRLPLRPKKNPDDPELSRVAADALCEAEAKAGSLAFQDACPQVAKSNCDYAAEKRKPAPAYCTATFKSDNEKLQIRRVEFVGPQVGKELGWQAATALLFVAIGIIIYLSIRFEWKLAVATVIANLHDVVIILGCFAFFRWEFGLPVLAAVLAILGYSVNESVVVFDRVRENFRKMRGASVRQIIDNAITATMSRTIITHGSTQLAVLAMLLFGGPALHGFALALTIGILFGIYSSVLVASPIAMWLGISREDFVKPKKEGEAGAAPARVQP
jgi:preprotein translocase subunit SecF